LFCGFGHDTAAYSFFTVDDSLSPVILCRPTIYPQFYAKDGRIIFHNDLQPYAKTCRDLAQETDWQ
jgi:hypothetical protein